MTDAEVTPVTLTEFLLARIAEDEAVARWEPDVYACWSGAETDQALTQVADLAPGRLLAECEVKRWYVETFKPIDPAKYNDPEVLRRLALPYADHPDYRQEWRP